jgi:uncharacterized repeat protein (TIGR03803 family)
MHSHTILSRLSGTRYVLTFLVVLGLAALAPAQTFTTLHTFTGADGEFPYTGVVRDKAGNLYGTTLFGGATWHGVVFKLNTAGKETVLYSFCTQSSSCVCGRGVGATSFFELGHGADRDPLQRESGGCRWQAAERDGGSYVLALQR